MLPVDTHCKPKKYIVEFTTQTNPKVVNHVIEEIKEFIKERTGNMVGNVYSFEQNEQYYEGEE